MKHLLWIGLIAAVAFGGLSQPSKVQFVQGTIATPDSIVYEKLLTGASSACTTRAVAIRDWGRYPSVGFGAYLASGNSGAESASYDVYYQWGYDTIYWDSRIDTVIENVVGVPGDSLATGYRYFIEEFYPRVCRFVRFIFTANADNGDSVYIFPVHWLGDDGN